MRIVSAIFGSLAAWFLLDAALFRTNFYPSVIEPDSTTGLLENVLRREQLAQRHYGDNMVVLTGDSRVAFLPRIANQPDASVGYTPTGYAFRLAGVAGSDARSEFYLLRDLDPTRRRYRALCIGVSDIDDSENDIADHADELSTLHYVIKRLRLSDVWDFTSSYHNTELQWEAFRGSLFKGLVYQKDLFAFLDHPAKRLAYVRQVHEGFESWSYDFVPEPHSLAGLQADWPSEQVTVPANFTPQQRAAVDYIVNHKPMPEHRLPEYRRLWFGRICDLYKGSRTKVIFFREPRSPIPFPPEWYIHSGTTIRDLAARQSNVMILDEHTLEYLERPENFGDAMHLNRAGVNEFSRKLSQEVAKLLGPANAL